MWPVGAGTNTAASASNAGPDVLPSSGADVHAVAKPCGDDRAERERLRVQADELPAVELVERADRGAREWPAVRLELHGDQVALRPGSELLHVHARRDDAVVTGIALRCGRGRLGRGGEERVDASP